MESFHITDDFFESLENEIPSTNQQLFNTMKGKDDFLYSVEFIKIAFSENLLDDIEFLKNFTPLTLFSPENIIKYDTRSFMCLGVLLISAVLFWVIAMEKFKKRDLSL